MKHRRSLAILAALALSFGCARSAQEAGQRPTAPASSQVQFPDLPLKRDATASASASGSVAWTVLFLAVVAGVGMVLIRRRGVEGLRPPPGWFRAGASNAGVPVARGRTALTQQASVHVVEWKGEELLLGCTPHSVALLARAPAVSAATGTKGEGART